MLRILIADDEPLVLVGLKSLIDWESLNAVIVAEATNGKTALEAAEKLHPDIIITDVTMPVMNGLELIAEVKKRGISSKFIILSSYDEFAYVKKAMQLHVSDYWLKMELTEKTVRAGIEKLAAEISAENTESRRASLSEQNLSATQEVFFNNLLLSYFPSAQELAREQQNCGVVFSGEGMYVLNVIIDDETLLKRCDAAYNRRRLYASVKDLAKTVFSEYGTNYVISYKERKIAVLAGFSGSLERFDALLDEICADFIEYCRKYFNVRLCVGISEPIYNLADFAVGLSQAQFALYQYFYDRAISVCRFIRPQVGLEEGCEKLADLQRKIALAFERADVVSACALINELAALISSGRLNHSRVLNTCFNVVQFAATLFENGNGIVDQALPGLEKNLLNMYNLNTVQDAKNALLKISEAIAQHAATRRDYGKEQFANAVRSYVDEHLCEHFDLQKIADFMCMSATYFCSVFKKHLGLTFTEYVNGQKIERAKQLLLSGKYKVYEVADALGFENAYYFSRVFKKIAKCSPKEYLETLSSRS